MTRVNLPEAQQRLGELLTAVDHGEEVVITSDRGMQYQVVQVPSMPKRSRGGYGALKGQIWMSDDFNAPMDEDGNPA